MSLGVKPDSRCVVNEAMVTRGSADTVLVSLTSHERWTVRQNVSCQCVVLLRAGQWPNDFMKTLLAVIVALTLVGCKDSTRAQFSALGKRHQVTLYGASGNVIKTWVATGNVSNQSGSDGWYFEDEATHRLVEVTGTLLIEVL